MNDATLAFGQLGAQVLAGLAIGYGVLCVYRWIRRESPLLAAIVAAGLLVRAALGLALFWTSYLDLSFLRDLHTADGYWLVAPDAREYAIRAARASVDGLATVGLGSASPAYVQLLALWMRVVGISPLSGMFLNLVMYALLCALLVLVWKPRGTWRGDLPCVVLITALSFAPGHVIHGTQSLKDDMFTFLVALGSVGALLALKPVFDGWQSVRPTWVPVCGLAALLVAVYYAAGIRTYYSFFMLASLTAVLVLFGVRRDMKHLRRSVPLTAVILLLTSVAYTAGAGSYEFYLRPLLGIEALASRRNTAETVPWQIWRYVDIARNGFMHSGGATNVARRDAQIAATNGGRTATRVPAGATTRAEGAIAREDVAPESPHARLEQLGVGLSTLFIPVSVLRAASMVDFPDARGLLVVTDVDTVFIDATILASLILVYTRRETARTHLPYVCFLLLLGCATVTLMAYTVTNFGTLFRLRMMIVVPFWMLALSTSGGRFMPESTPDRLRAARASQPVLAGRHG